jgi:formylglycine-generating enzyme required for sulfatase activity
MRAARLALIATGAACSASAGQLPPLPQAVVSIDTDAPVPRMVDRMHVEVVSAPGEAPCATCAHEFAFDETTTWPAAFGIEQPADGSPRWVRVVLYPAGRVIGGQPQRPTAIERIGRVPFDGSVVHVRLTLSLDCAGRPSSASAWTTCVDDAHAAEPLADAPADDGSPGRPGSWRSAVARGCSSTPRGGEVCVRGGVYWMGDVRVRSFGGGHDAVPEHAVAVSPFFLDRDLYTVGRYREALARGFVPQPGDVTARTGTAQSGNGCGYSDPPDASDPQQDERPLTCVSAAAAARLCAFDGARLPSEAEHEWAAGSREHEWLYPWGDDDACGLQDVNCYKDTVTIFPYALAVGANAYDVSIDGVRDLVGNGAQWLRDSFALYDEPCWAPGAYGTDPVCAPRPAPSALGFSARGQLAASGDAAGNASRMAGYRSARIDDASAIRSVGMTFRCARDDAP